MKPVVLITGGTRGIGLALCSAFARNGWKVGACYHDDEASAALAAGEIAKLTPDFDLSRCDVTKEKEVQQWTRRCLDRFGEVDCAIHNAGFNLNARVLNAPEADWDSIQEVHLKGAFWLSKFCLRPMLKKGSGHLIFISSVVATTGNIGQAAYVSAKAGVIGLGRSLAREYGSKNIRVNMVLPGFHKTRLSAELTPEAEQAIRGKHLLSVTTEMGETASFMVWLAGTRTISGQVFNLDSRIPGWI
jgi:3-oxoacyl-[acyl-carrier protein] reductase